MSWPRARVQAHPSALKTKRQSMSVRSTCNSSISWKRKAWRRTHHRLSVISPVKSTAVSWNACTTSAWSKWSQVSLSSSNLALQMKTCKIRIYSCVAQWISKSESLTWSWTCLSRPHIPKKKKFSEKSMTKSNNIFSSNKWLWKIIG